MFLSQSAEIPRGSCQAYVLASFHAEKAGQSAQTRRALPNKLFRYAVDLLAFGRAKIAIGLSDIDEQAAQLRAGIALINAAIEGKVELLGTPCERLVRHPHRLRRTGRRTVIGSDTLPDLIPVPFGGRDWLGPRLYADEYAEIGHAQQSVSFCDVRVERATLRKWLTTVSAKAPGLREADVRSRPKDRCIS